MTARKRLGASRDARGVVLIDVLVSMVFVLLLIGMAQTWARSLLFVQRVLEVAVAADQDATLALARLAREIRDAGYDEASTVPPIVTAGPDHLELIADLNGDGDTGDSFEHVAYAYRADRRQVTRRSGNGSAQPFADNVPPGGFRLSYWTGNGQPVGVAAPALSMTELDQVRRIDVSLDIEAPNPDPRSFAPIRAEASLSVALRNR
jgi:hypothetical protein